MHLGNNKHTRARPRGAADGERTEADGQTEKGTDGVRPREANATERAVEYCFQNPLLLLTVLLLGDGPHCAPQRKDHRRLRKG